MIPLIKTEQLTKHFYQGKSTIHAVDTINFDLLPGEILGIVGESGSGKTTLGKLLIGLLKPTSGRITFNGNPLKNYSRLEKARLIQMIFQDWQSSLNPKMLISQILAEGWLIHRLVHPQEMKDRLVRLLEDFQLDAEILKKTPRQLSGGQLQRVTMARALSLNPKVLIADEPTSSLDIPLRRQVLELLKNKTHQMGLSLIIISHDIDAVLSLANRIFVMFRGKFVEVSTPAEILSKPIHPYTTHLLESADLTQKMQ